MELNNIELKGKPLFVVKSIFIILITSIVILIIYEISFNIYMNVTGQTGYEARAEITTPPAPLDYIDILNVAKESEPNTNIYSSGQTLPKDPLFDVFLIAQNRSYGNDLHSKIGYLSDNDMAYEIDFKFVSRLMKLIEAGNDDALYIYSRFLFRRDITKGLQDEALLMASQMGNPYAQIKMETLYDDCEEVLGESCSRDWNEKGWKQLQSLGAKGDAIAQYMAMKHQYTEQDSWDKESILKTVTQAAKANYFAPLFEQLKIYHRYRYKRKFTVRSSDEDQLQDQALGKLMLYMADQNYLPALETLLIERHQRYLSKKEREDSYKNYLNEKQYEELLIKAVKLGSYDTMDKAVSYYNKSYSDSVKQGSPDKSKLILALKYDEMSRMYIYAKKELILEDSWKALSASEKANITKEAKLFIKDELTPVVYLTINEYNGY